MKQKYHDPVTGRVEGVRLPRSDLFFTAESNEKIKAKLEKGKGPLVRELAKYLTAPEALRRKMLHAAHLRKLRTLHEIYNPDDENEI